MAGVLECFSKALGDVHDRGYAVIESVMAKDELDAYREILNTHGPISDGSECI